MHLLYGLQKLQLLRLFYFSNLNIQNILLYFLSVSYTHLDVYKRQVINKSGIPSDKIDFCFAGDLLNQCISSSFGLRELNIPFFGVFGACSTFVESMCLGAMCVESFAENVLCATSSHFCSAEKQFRFPLELGNQRPPSAQWTVTGSGATILTKSGQGPFITTITPVSYTHLDVYKRQYYIYILCVSCFI